MIKTFVTCGSPAISHKKFMIPGPEGGVNGSNKVIQTYTFLAHCLQHLHGKSRDGKVPRPDMRGDISIVCGPDHVYIR